MAFARLMGAIAVLVISVAVHAAPMPPVAPVSPESAYVDCSGEFGQVRGIHGKLASLRRCRGRIEHFQTTYLRSYAVALQRYRTKLNAYRDDVKASEMTKDEKQAARQVFQREVERLSPGGDLLDAHNRLTDRSTRDLQFINEQICRLGRLGGPRCR